MQKAKRKLLMIEIPRDELALRMMAATVSARPPAGMTAKQALDAADIANPGIAADFYRAADAAVAYFHERINVGVQPS